MHPSIALASLVKDIKLASSDAINLFPNFNGWQDGYGAFTYSFDAKEKLIEYAKNQEAHHKKASYINELTALLKEHDVEYDPKYLQ